MVNAWSLLYDEYYGTMNETFPVKNTEPDDTIKISTGSTESAGPKFVSFDLNDPNFNVGIDTSNYEYTITGGDTLDLSGLNLDGCTVNWDMNPDLAYMEPGTELKTDADTVYADTWPHAETLNIKMPDDYPSAFTTLSDNDDAIAHHVAAPLDGAVELWDDSEE